MKTISFTLRPLGLVTVGLSLILADLNLNAQPAERGQGAPPKNIMFKKR